MKKGGGGRKGSSFEREFCSMLSLWWTGGESDSVFYRTGGSGGRATRRGRKGQSTVNHCGDVGASDPVGMPLMKLAALELKRGYNDASLQDVLDSPKSPEYLKWFAQAEESARHAGAMGWVVVIRRDKRRALVFLDYGTWCSLLSAGARIVGTPNVTLYFGEGTAAVGMRLDDFFRNVTPDHVRAAAGG